MLSLSAHFFFFHEIFDFYVICFEEDGSTNIEYSIDGKSCIDHNNASNDNLITFSTVEENDCKDISFSESIHCNDQFVVKKNENTFSNSPLISSSLVNLSYKQNFIQAYNYFTTIQSNLIQQLKTVSLLI